MRDAQLITFARWLRSQRWTFAKTMADNPHEYLVRHQLDGLNEELFVAFVLAIRKHGYDEEYEGYTYRVMDVAGHKYWTMGNPIRRTTILNRKAHRGYDVEQELRDMGVDPAAYL